MDIVGETRLTLQVIRIIFILWAGLVMKNLDVEVLAGTLFMESSDVGILPAKRQISLRDDILYSYGSHGKSKISHSNLCGVPIMFFVLCPRLLLFSQENFLSSNCLLSSQMTRTLPWNHVWILLLRPPSHNSFQSPV